MPFEFWLEGPRGSAREKKTPAEIGVWGGVKGAGKSRAVTALIEGGLHDFPGSGEYAPPPSIALDRPLEISKYSRGRLDLLARGRGVPSTVEIDGVEHLVAAIVTSKDGFVWAAPPDPGLVTKKVRAIRQECREALSKTPRADLPVQTCLIANGEPRVITALWGNRQGPGWYVYLCVPRPPEDPAQTSEPKKPSRSRFRNLEL